ncbi:MAG: hypothetical protein ATN36_02610 [Epulopiscium sp. Nele67-Bin005]|nr:MAG: hypothetical protein ATN36_02610 [Epulopiscium sp. Nele67-Bin005]
MLIAIDAGHGGYDPGAVGVTGTQEKAICLIVALKLDELLRGAGLRTYLIRSSDVYYALSTRATMANTQKADYYISIHANSATAASANGAETYVYYLGDQTEEFAQSVQASIISATGFTNRGVKTGNFAVLRETSMPAILVEMGFLSNSTEEAKLKDTSFLNVVAEAIFEGTAKFLGIDITSTPEVVEPEIEHWGQSAIDELFNMGIITSNKTPTANIIWAEFATVILRALDLNISADATAGEHWGQPAIDELLKRGLITSDKTPSSTISWAEFATVLLRVLDYNK